MLLSLMLVVVAVAVICERSASSFAPCEQVKLMEYGGYEEAKMNVQFSEKKDFENCRAQGHLQKEKSCFFSVHREDLIPLTTQRFSLCP
jgi:hypothetical protein